MRRSDHPSRPSAITCCRFSGLKTLRIPAAGVQPTAQVNVSAPGAPLAGCQVSLNGRFLVSTEARTDRHAAFSSIQGGNALDHAALALIPDDLVVCSTLVHLSTSAIGTTSSP